MSVSMNSSNSRPISGPRRIVYNDDGDGMQLYTKQGQVRQDMDAMIDEQFESRQNSANSAVGIRMLVQLYSHWAR